MNTDPVRSPASGAGEEKPGDAERVARLLPLILPVTGAGALALAAAAWTFFASAPSAAVIAGVLVLLAAASLAEAYPVPVERLPACHVSLAAVFVVGTALIHGWAAATLIACLTRLALELLQRRPLARLAYNGAVYALGGAAAGIAGTAFPLDREALSLILAVMLSASAFYVVNVVLVTAVIALWARERFTPLLRRTAYWTIVPFAIMASVSLMLQVLWERSPVVTAALAGPLVAIVLYQRSTHSALAAMRLALTDPLTGLGNRRHFHERLERDLDRAQAERLPVTICLLDVDDFKRWNDEHGHDEGDRVLTAVAGCLRHGGEAFRLGGDEFALLLPGKDAGAGLAIAEAVVARVAAAESDVRVSAGLATYPEHALERSELLRLADAALYCAKREGKSRVVRHSDARSSSALSAATAA